MCNLGLQEFVTVLQHVKHHSHIDVCKEHILVPKHFNKLIQLLSIEDRIFIIIIIIIIIIMMHIEI